MHFHRVKEETWRVLSGRFFVGWIDTKTAEHQMKVLSVGDTWTNRRLVPHRLKCIEPGVILEVSTHDDPEDNYRVSPGDSQQ